MIKVLFVCLGNICRSPMAEAVFQELVNQAELGNKIVADSAGTSGWHESERAHGGTLDVLRRNNITYNGRSRKFSYLDLDEFDYIVAMDKSNFNDLVRICDGMHPKVTMFLSYANRAGYTSLQEVPDPYYTGGFDQVFELVKAGSQALLNHIRREHNL